MAPKGARRLPGALTLVFSDLFKATGAVPMFASVRVGCNINASNESTSPKDYRAKHEKYKA